MPGASRAIAHKSGIYNKAVRLDAVSCLTVNLYQYAVAVVDLVLDDLGGEAGVACRFPYEAGALIFDTDGLVSYGRSGTAEQGETAFLGLIHPRLADDLGIVHHGVFAVIAERDDALRHADHICRHADAGLTVHHERVEQVPPDEDIILDSILRFDPQKQRVVYKFLDHMIASIR